MAKRKPISKKIRFEVFKRDSFKCQYCGKGAPDVILELDHISPVSKGGDNDILNLITACKDCNAGKSDRELSDDSAIQKQRQQLEELNERREQLEMMLKWREGMKGIDDISIGVAHEAWKEFAKGFYLNESGLTELRKYIKKYGLNSVLDSIEIAGRQYIKSDDNGNVIQESLEIALTKMGGILRLKSKPEYIQDLYYTRGILRNRLHYVNERNCMEYLEKAYQTGISTDELKQIARTVRNWTEFQNTMLEIINGER